MSISSVTAFGPITSTMFPQTAGSSASANGTTSASASGTPSQSNSVVQDFLDYAKMSPAERMRENILKSRDDRAAVRKALAGATAGRESEDPADHAATDSAKRGQDRPACKRLRLRFMAHRRRRVS